MKKQNGVVLTKGREKRRKMKRRMKRKRGKWNRAGEERLEPQAKEGELEDVKKEKQKKVFSFFWKQRHRKKRLKKMKMNGVGEPEIKW